MSTLWHFGDSFGTCGKEEIIFSKYIADHFGMNHSHHAVGGSSNRTILQSIVGNIHQFYTNDMILINWSLNHRFDYIIIQENQKKLCPTSGNDMSEHLEQSTYIKDYKTWILDGSLNYADLEQYKLYLVIYELFDSLQKLGISIFNAYINELPHWSPSLPSHTITFDGQIGKADWITNNRYWNPDKNATSHYIDGVQERIGNYYIKQMRYLNNTTTDHSIQVDNSQPKLF